MVCEEIQDEELKMVNPADKRRVTREMHGRTVALL